MLRQKTHFGDRLYLVRKVDLPPVTDRNATRRIQRPDPPSMRLRANPKWRRNGECLLFLWHVDELQVALRPRLLVSRLTKLRFYNEREARTARHLPLDRGGRRTRETGLVRRTNKIRLWR